MNKYLLIIAIIFVSSCAGTKYTPSKKATNNTFTVKTNVPIFSLRTNFDDKIISNTNSGSLTYTFPKLKKKYLKLSVDNPDYDTEQIKIKRVVRREAWWRSFGLGFFTYFTPFIFDYPNANFYKISYNSKAITVNLRHTEDYSHREFIKLCGYGDLKLFNKYLEEFKGYKDWTLAVDVRDSIALDLAITSGKIEEVSRFISNYPNSKSLIRANEAFSQFKEAKASFDNAIKRNTFSDINGFLAKYPNSIFRREAQIKLIDLAVSKINESNNIDTLIFYCENYIDKYNSVASSSKPLNDFAKKSRMVLTNNIKNTTGNSRDKLMSLWSYKRKVEELTNNNDTALYNRLNFKIFNYCFFKLKDCKSKSDNNLLVSEIESDFPGFIKETNYAFQNQEFLCVVVKNSDKPKGTYNFYNLNYYQFERLSRDSNDIIKSYLTNNRFVKLSPKVIIENITFNEDNKLEGSQTVYYDSEIVHKSKYLNGCLIFDESYSKKEHMVGHYYKNCTKSYFELEYNSGENITNFKIDTLIQKIQSNIDQNRYISSKGYYDDIINLGLPDSIMKGFELRSIKKDIERLKVVWEKEEAIRRQEEEKRDRIRREEQAKKDREEAVIKEAKMRALVNSIPGTYEAPSGAYIILRSNKTGIGRFSKIGDTQSFNWDYEFDGDNIRISWNGDNYNSGWCWFEKNERSNREILISGNLFENYEK